MAGTGCDCTPGEQDEHFSSGLGISVLLGASHALFWRKHSHLSIFPVTQRVTGRVFIKSFSLATGSPVLEWEGEPSDVVNQWGLLELSLRPRKNTFYYVRRFLLSGSCRPLGMCAGTFDRCRARQDGMNKMKLSLHFAFDHPM